MQKMISLELLNESHVAQLASIANHVEISKTSGVPPQCNEADVREWLKENQRSARREITFVVIADDQVAGCCILKKVDMEQQTAELAYWLGTDFWGKGIATRAAMILRDFAFDFFNLNDLHSHYLKVNNGPSGRILAKLGFEPDSTKPDLPVSDRFAHFQPDAWTFVILTRERWQSFDLPTWSIRSDAFNVK